jgi:hypothetical protein
MNQITIKNGKIQIEHETGIDAISLISGEVHYWRLDPASWLPALQRVRQMGLKVVASYVCWDFHEVAPGHYDFTGESDPRRNLTAFLDLLTAEGFWIIIRPGPYIYSEWRNGGVPDYAAQYHRLHPTFLERARPYMEAVVAAVKPYLASNGGKVILFQADNEIDPWPHYHTGQLGLGTESGPFQEFLRQRYGEIRALNDAWGTEHGEFDQARAVCALRPDEPDQVRRYLDFIRFQHWYVNEAARWNVNVYRELGVDVPVYLNTYSGTGTQHWLDLEALSDLAGPDIYPSHNFGHHPNEHRHFLEACRYTRAYSKLPYIAEFQAGIWHDWLPDVGALTPNHYRLACVSALLAGIQGWNWYMLVNRDNWYMSPINEWGRTRPDLFAAFQEITGLFHELDPASLTKLTDTAVSHHALQRGTERPGQELLQAIYEAGVDYEFFSLDSDTGHRGGDKKRLLFYAGGAWLPQAAQERLVAYLAGGGHLVCVGHYPRWDGMLKPLNRLQIPSDYGIVTGAPNKLRLAVPFGAQPATLQSPWLYHFNQVPGQPIVAERLPATGIVSEEVTLQTNLQVGRRYTVGYTQNVEQGRLTVLGLAPSAEMILAVHDAFNVPLYARSTTPAVATAVFRRDHDLYLPVANNGREPKVAAITLDADLHQGRRWQVADMLSGDTWTADFASTGSVTVSLPAKDGTVLRLTPR